MGGILKTLWDSAIFHPFLNLLFVLYHIFGDNLGLAVISIAVISRFALIPITKKQISNSQKMMKLRPRLEKIQKKFANNSEKLAKEQVKLYRELGYNPVGCFGTLFIQILILLAVVGVIRVVTNEDFSAELTGIYPFVKDWIVGSQESFQVNTGFLWMDLTKDYMSQVKECNCIPLEGKLFNIPFTFLAIALGPIRVPGVFPYLGLSILVGSIQFYTTQFMQYFQGMAPSKAVTKKKAKGEDLTEQEMQMEMSNSMTRIMPVMSVLIALSAPAVLGVYWFFQSIMSVIQYFLIDKEKALAFFKEKVSELVKHKDTVKK